MSKTNKPQSQSNSDRTSSNVRYTKFKALEANVEVFVDCAEKAEKDIRDNYTRGRTPPDCCGDNWNIEFAKSYEAIHDALGPYSKPHLSFGPSRTAYMSIPIRVSNPVEAWLYSLNPADMAYGEPGYLESEEYQSIKGKALAILKRIVNPRFEDILTETEQDLVRVTNEIPQTAQQLADKALCSYEAARKYLPGLYQRGFIIKAPKNGYYRIE